MEKGISGSVRLSVRWRLKIKGVSSLPLRVAISRLDWAESPTAFSTQRMCPQAARPVAKISEKYVAAGKKPVP